MKFEAKTRLDKIFEAGILIKAADGVLEVIGGILLLVVSPAQINNIVASITQRELFEDPRDAIATYLVHSTQNLGHAALIFGSIYLLAHGIVKFVLVYEILHNRLWAYPGLIVMTAGFMIYQTYRYTVSASLWLVILTVFDAVVVYLTVLEYNKRRKLLVLTRETKSGE